MSYKWKGALWRLARVLLYGGLAYLVQYLTAHLAGYNIPDLYLPLITAALTAADKWIREQLAEL
ncbi:MAG: hypothetical protein ACYC6A_00870 [Armatimonadota bacterium]